MPKQPGGTAQHRTKERASKAMPIIRRAGVRHEQLQLLVNLREASRNEWRNDEADDSERGREAEPRRAREREREREPREEAAAAAAAAAWGLAGRLQARKRGKQIPAPILTLFELLYTNSPRLIIHVV